MPAPVRYDQSLSANAKVLYSEISALVTSGGYCESTNRYFATLYKVNKNTVSEWVRQLIAGGHIKVTYIPNSIVRRIYPTLTHQPAPNGITEVKKRKKEETGTYTEEFEGFWNYYPRKIAKKSAFRCWKTQLKKGNKPFSITLAAKNYMKYCKIEGRIEEKIMHGSTFLGPDDRWEDYATTKEPVDPGALPEYHPDKVDISPEEYEEGSKMAKNLSRKFGAK